MAGDFLCAAPGCNRYSVSPAGRAAHMRSAHPDVPLPPSTAARNKRKRVAHKRAGALVKVKAKPKAAKAESLYDVGIDLILAQLLPKGCPPEKMPLLVRWIELTLELRGAT